MVSWRDDPRLKALLLGVEEIGYPVFLWMSASIFLVSPASQIISQEFA